MRETGLSPRLKSEFTQKKCMSQMTPFGIIVGGDARVPGVARLPLIANFAVDRDVLFKDVV